MAFRWRADDGPFIVIFGFSIPSTIKKINVIKFGPSLTKLSGSAHEWRSVSRYATLLTHLRRMEFSTVINWTSPFPF